MTHGEPTPYRTVIRVEELRRHLHDPAWVIFDCRHELMNPEAGAQAYAESHIPGARFAHSDRDLAGPRTGRNGRHPLPDPAAFMAWLGANGVDATKQLVAYDYAGGASAARLWWMLRWLGHEDVAVLDGGWDAWVQAGAPVSREAPSIQPAPFSGKPSALWVDADYVQAHLGDRSMVIVDARSPERYRGETEPIDPVAGHIPGALNRLYKDNLGPDGRFKPPEELLAAFDSLLQGRSAEQVVHQCGSGVSACHNILAMEIAGLTGSRLYPGSWSEWCADPARPVARGSA